MTIYAVEVWFECFPVWEGIKTQLESYLMHERRLNVSLFEKGLRPKLLADSWVSLFECFPVWEGIKTETPFAGDNKICLNVSLFEKGLRLLRFSPIHNPFDGLNVSLFEKGLRRQYLFGGAGNHFVWMFPCLRRD